MEETKSTDLALKKEEFEGFKEPEETTQPVELGSFGVAKFDFLIIATQGPCESMRDRDSGAQGVCHLAVTLNMTSINTLNIELRATLYQGPLLNPRHQPMRVLRLPKWAHFKSIISNFGPTSGPMDFKLQGPLYGPLCKVGLKLRPTSSPSRFNSKWAQLQMGPNIKWPLVLLTI